MLARIAPNRIEDARTHTHTNALASAFARPRCGTLTVPYYIDDNIQSVVMHRHTNAHTHAPRLQTISAELVEPGHHRHSANIVRKDGERRSWHRERESTSILMVMRVPVPVPKSGVRVGVGEQSGSFKGFALD